MNNIKNNIASIIKLLFVANVIFFSSCQATKFLKDGEKFLRSSNIILKTNGRVQNKILLKEELNTLIKQKPRESILHVPRYWFYYVAKDKKSKLARFARKQFAQDPPIFNENDVKETVKAFENFLRYKKGFFNVKVDYKIYEEKYVVDVDFIIHTGKRYVIKDVNFECEDNKLCDIIKKDSIDSYLKPGDGLDYLNYDLEKIRITNLLQNNSYATFNQNAIELYGDSADYKTSLHILIKNPPEDSFRIYKTGKIEIFTDYYPEQTVKSLKSDTIENLVFYHELPDYLINPNLLYNAINLKEGELYRKNKTSEIYNKLSKFAVYRFVSIKTIEDTLNKDKLNYKIYLYTQENKYYAGGDFALKYVTLSKEEQFVQFGGNGSFNHRKLSGRGDYLNLTGSGDIKINLQNNKYSELNIVGKMDYINPISPIAIKFSPLYLYNTLFTNTSTKTLKNKTTTNFSLSYLNQTFLEKFIISSLNANYGYNYKPNKKSNILVNQIGINYLTPQIFDDSLFNVFQRNSMENAFLTGLVLKNLTYSYNSLKKNRLYNYSLLFGLETSGLEILATNKINNWLFDKSGYWQFNKNIGYAKFFKTYIEYKPKYKTSTTSELAGRLFFGLGIPFGDTKVLPYINQFEIGGPYSMRAWAVRELGPGSYHQSISKDEIPFQKGDMRFEANLEYRFKLSYLFKSAVFVDAGNIWTLKSDPERPGGQFTKNFYKQIAIDAGVSIQLDVVVLLRLDLAYKLRNAYPDENGSYFGAKDFIPNIVFAINHPF